MAEAVTIAKIKKALRISHAQLDDEIGEEIDACLADLRICGINIPAESDPAILAALKLWCRASHTDDTARMKAFRDAYDELKGTLQVAEGYGGAVADG